MEYGTDENSSPYPLFDIYTVQDDIFCRDDRHEAVHANEQIIISLNPDAGETVYLVLYGDEGYYGTGSVIVCEKNLVQSLSIQPDAVYSPQNVWNRLSEIPLTITYSDGTTETISEWDGSWADSTLVLHLQNGEIILLEVYKDTEKIPVPGSAEGIPFGTFTLKASVERNTSVSAEAQIKIQGIQDAFAQISDEQPLEGSVLPNEPKLATFVPKSSGKYLIEANTNAWTLYEADENEWKKVPYMNGYDLEAGKTYAVTMLATWGNAENYYLTARLKREIASLELRTESSYLPVDLAGKFRTVPMTVTYTDGSSEEITWWGGEEGVWDDENFTCMSYTAWSENSDYFSLSLIKDDVKTAMPYPNQFFEAGTYTCAVYMSQNPAVCVEKTVTVEGIPEGLSEIELEKVTEFEASDSAVKWLLFTPQQTDSYAISIVPEEYVELQISVLEVKEEGLRDITNIQGWGTFSTAIGMEAGKTYAFMLYPESKGTAASGTVEMHRQKKVTEISLSSDIYEYSFIEAPEKLLQLPVTVTYDDGTAAVITNWKFGNIWDENGEWYRSIQADAGDGQWLRLHLENKDGSFVSIPYDNRYEMKVYGSFQMVVDMETDASFSSTAELEISGAADSMQKLTIGEKTAVSVDADQKQLLTLDVSESGTYLVEYERNNGGALSNFAYRLMDGTAENTWNGWWYDDGYLILHATEAESYVFLLEEEWSEDTDGVISIRKQKDISSVKMDDEKKMDLFAAKRELRNTEITITYADESSEVLHEWSDSWYYDEETDRDILCLEQRSDERHHYRIRMYDEQGYPVDISGSDYNYMPVGNYTLKLYLKNESTGEEEIVTGAVQALTITEPETEMLTVGEEKSVTFIGESDYHVFGLTVEEGAEGLYYFRTQCDTADVSVDVFRYNETDKTVEHVGGNGNNLSVGSYYYLCESRWGNQGKNPAEICLVKVPEISSVEIVENAGLEKLVAGLDKIPYDQLRAKIMYADGTEKLVEDYETDSYENRMRILCYKYNEDGTVNFQKGYRYNGTLPEGNYYLAAVVSCMGGEVKRGGMPLTVVTKEEAAAENVISAETNAIMLAGKPAYNCALYIPEKDGYYLLKPDMYLDQLRIFDAAGELDYQWVDDYSIRVELTGGNAYVIAACAGERKNYTMNIEPERQIVGAQVLYVGDRELIGGFDWFSPTDFIVDLDLGNGETISVNGSDSYADGNGFRYEIIDTATGQKVNSIDRLSAGTYEVVAVQRTGSAVYRTSSAVYDTENAIHQNTVKPEPVTITVSALDVSKLPVIEEEKEYDLKPRGSRQMFAFTPEKDAFYTLEREAWISWSIYEVSEDGYPWYLDTYGNMLKAGQTYVLYLDMVNEAQTVKMTSEIQKLNLDTVLKEQINAYSRHQVQFIAEASGNYKFTVEMPDSDGYFDVQINGNYEDSGSKEEPVRVSTYLEEGDSLFISVQNDTDCPASCLISVEEEDEDNEDKTLKSYSVRAKTTDGFYAEYMDYYNKEKFFEIIAVFDDGTSMIYDLDEWDVEEWDSAWVDEYELIGETDTTATYKCRICVSGHKNQYTDVELTLDKVPQETSLKEGQAVSAQVSASRYNFFRFNAPEDEWYYLDISGIDSYDCYTSGSQKFNNRYYFRAGINSLIVLRLDDYSDEVGKSFTIKIVKAKDVAGMKLLTPAEPFVYGIGGFGAEMTAEVTYTDGSSAVISGRMSEDAYGNEISIKTRALSNGRRRVYMQCGTSRISCDVEAFDYATLPQISANKCCWADIGEKVDNYRKPVLFSFVPSKTGTYTCSYQGNGFLSLGVTYIQDVKTQRRYTSTADLTAGKHYVIAVHVLEADCEQIGLTIYNAEAVCGEHDWDTGSIEEAATCCTNGVMIYRCTACDETKKEVIPADGVSHKFIMYTANGDAACLSNGTETAVCANGCGVTHTRKAETGATGHSFTTYVSDGNATCEADGTKTAKCDNCPATKSVIDEGSATGHEYGAEWTVIKAAACTESGLRIRYCSHNCGASESEVIPAVGHNYEGQEKLTKEPTEESDGMIYQECKNGCGEINVIQVLVRTAEQEKINGVADIVNVEEGAAVDTAAAVEQIQNISNQALIDSVETTDESGITTGVDGMKLVTDLEEQIKADTSEDTANVGDTLTVDGTGEEISEASAAGAAVTVAAAIQKDEKNTYQAGETYHAQLEISEENPTSAVMTAEDEEETADTGNVYVVDIHLNIVDSENQVVAENVPLAAPIQVTMPVPEEMISGQTKLYHLVEGEAVEVKYTSNGNGTISFYAPSFSTWSLENDHKVVAWTVDKAATCMQAGQKSGLCIGCGQTVTEVIETAAHQYEDKLTPATCCTAGEAYKECSVCHDKKAVNVIPATGEHAYSAEGVVITEATCTENGTMRFACTTEGCSACKEEPIPKGHSYDTQFTVDKEATCTTAGSKSIHCNKCGDKINTIEIPATGHDLQTVVDKTATCGEAGSQHAECKNCTYKEAATAIPATGKHDLQTVVDKKATCGEAGSQHAECKNCTYKEAAAEIKATGKHSYGAYEVTKEATALAQGEETRICSVCGNKDSKAVNKLQATIKLTAKSIPLQVKKSVNLKQVVTGLAKGDKIVSWSSGKKSVATVSKSGKVTAKKAGTAKITVTLASKKTATITVKVQKKAVKATKISNVKNVTLYLKKQKTFKLEPIVTPISTFDKITYTSSNKKIVTVSKKGVLTAKKKGKAKITIKCGSKKKTITVTVKK